MTVTPHIWRLHAQRAIVHAPASTLSPHPRTHPRKYHAWHAILADVALYNDVSRDGPTISSTFVNDLSSARRRASGVRRAVPGSTRDRFAAMSDEIKVHVQVSTSGPPTSADAVNPPLTLDRSPVLVPVSSYHFRRSCTESVATPWTLAVAPSRPRQRIAPQ
jgi:hypothetical protein